MGTKIIYVGIIIMIIVLAWFSLPQVWSANAQQNTRQILKELENEGKRNCEVWQINDFLYKPVRINIVHQPVKEHQVSVTSEGGGEANWDGSPETFQLLVRDTDRYRVELVLDYEVKHEEPRQVFYQVFAEGRNLVMEGNWVHEGFTFCKIIDFWTDEAPTELTEEEIIDINNKFNSEFRQEQASSSTTIQTALLMVGIVIVVGILLMITFFAIILISQRSMAQVTKRPEKKLNQMIERVRKLTDLLTLQNQYFLSTSEEMKTNIIKKIDNSLKDLAIMAVGTKNKVQLVESFPSAESLVQKSGKQVSTSTPVVDEKQQKDNEQVYAEEYGLKSIQQARPEVSFVDLVEKEQPISHETEAEINSDVETIEFDVKDIKPCVYCGKAPMYFCADCKKMYCKEHESHKCEGKEKKSLGASSLISKKIQEVVKSVMEKKDSIVNDDNQMQKLFDDGLTQKEVTDLLVKEYMKIPYSEGRELYDVMVKKYDKKKTYLESIRVKAMMERLVRSPT